MPSSKKDDQNRSPGARRVIKGLALVGAVGWIAAAALFADKINAQNLTGSLHNALVRSQTERHELSKQLKTMSDELEVLEQWLTRYRNQETRAAVNP